MAKLFYIFAQGTLMGITPIIAQLLGAQKQILFLQLYIKVSILLRS